MCDCVIAQQERERRGKERLRGHNERDTRDRERLRVHNERETREYHGENQHVRASLEILTMSRMQSDDERDERQRLMGKG